ncbi:hypothetical protein ACFOJ6_12035 [Gordonia humi]|uniref:hypothetical protein n=1 Tax=Gordonia humi TaxID=686429 RepID=UPI0036132CEF
MAHRVTRRQFISSSAAALALGVGASGVAPRASAAVDPVDLGVLRAGSGGAAGGRIVGLIDAHAHLAASKAFGGTMRCGSPIGPIQEALAGCEAHAGLGTGALLEAIVGGGDLAAGRDGWPTFRTWPTYNSELHEQAYYRFVERAWRGGLRVINALLVSNRVIAELYSGMSKRIDEMDEVRVQHRFVHRMQDYIDRECGGPGKGWFRIARTPRGCTDRRRRREARGGARRGELGAVRRAHRRRSSAMHRGRRGSRSRRDGLLGINNLFPVHKFDNAFGGTRFDPGVTGIAINIGNRLSTGRFWRAEPAGDGPADHSVEFAADDFARLLRSVPALRGWASPSTRRVRSATSADSPTSDAGSSPE